MCNLDEIDSALLNSGELHGRMVRQVGSCTVALFALYNSFPKEGEHLKLAGTGTLLAVDGSHYILTAAHVWREVLESADRVGITVTEDISHRFAVDVRTIVSYGPPKPITWGEWGPDITLLRIPSEHLGTLKAHKLFYNPTLDGAAAPTTDHIETSVLMGTPEALGTFTRKHADVQINGLFVDPHSRYQNRDGFDYFDLKMDMSFPGTPETFGGVSGGGLWRIRVYCACETGKINWTQTLEGVAFYQSAVENGCRTIRCHGPKSILSAIALI